MPGRASRHRAHIKLGPIITLVVIALGVMTYFWKFSPAEHQLSASLIRFEVTTEPDEARTPPYRESLAATISFANKGKAPETISKARFLVSRQEDLSTQRSWSPTAHRDAMLRDLQIPPGESITHTLIIPWTGREETLYFPDDSKIHLGLSVSAKAESGETVTLTEHFGHVIQKNGVITGSDSQPLVLDFSRK